MGQRVSGQSGGGQVKGQVKGQRVHGKVWWGREGQSLASLRQGVWLSRKQPIRLVETAQKKKLCCQILVLKRVIYCKIIPSVWFYAYINLLCASLYQNHAENAEALREESSEDNPMVEVWGAGVPRGFSTGRGGSIRKDADEWEWERETPSEIAWRAFGEPKDRFKANEKTSWLQEAIRETR